MQLHAVLHVLLCNALCGYLTYLAITILQLIAVNFMTNYANNSVAYAAKDINIRNDHKINVIHFIDGQ